jgi:hypothetical protein
MWRKRVPPAADIDSDCLQAPAAPPRPVPDKPRYGASLFKWYLTGSILLLQALPLSGMGGGARAIALAAFTVPLGVALVAIVTTVVGWPDNSPGALARRVRRCWQFLVGYLIIDLAMTIFL